MHGLIRSVAEDEPIPSTRSSSTSPARSVRLRRAMTGFLARRGRRRPMKFHRDVDRRRVRRRDQRIEDDQGVLRPQLLRRRFVEQRLDPTVAECNISFQPPCRDCPGAPLPGTAGVRDELVRCTQGRDPRRRRGPASEKWTHVQADVGSSSRRRPTALFILEGPARWTGSKRWPTKTRGRLPDGEKYTPGADRGVRHDDPLVAVEWPLAISTISEKDTTWPLLEPWLQVRQRKVSSSCRVVSR